MATLTYDPSSQDEPEFNEAEQEALAIGEAHAAEEQQLLAGKFEDAEALEQAYIELQKKLGANNEEVSEVSEDEVQLQEEGDDEEEVSPAQERIAQASEEWDQNGQLSEETIAELQQLPSEELIAAYLNSQQQVTQQADFSDAEVAAIHNDVGGSEEYGQIMSWAQDSLAPELVESYNSLVDKGDPMQVRLALAGLQAAYNDSNGSEGELLTGRGAVDKADVFRSQAEVVEAMSDPRYDRDPAYRQDVFAKLERSELQY
jgi:hypothetical protein